MLESEMWKRLRNALSYIPTHWQRIETTTGSGVPDMEACCCGQQSWIEGKVLLGKRKFRFRHPLKDLQHIWITERIAAGGTVKIVAMHDDASFVVVWDGRHSADLLDGPKLELGRVFPWPLVEPDALRWALFNPERAASAIRDTLSA